MSAATSTNESTKSRQQISALVELSLSTARTRRHIDPLGLNSRVQKGIDECNESLRVLEKEGGPENPGAAPKEPKKLKANASEDEVAAYTESMTAYTKAKEEWVVNNQAWKDFKSNKYEKLETVHNCYKLLSKLSNNLLKKKPSKRIQDEVTALQLQLTDKPKARGPDETADAYKNRVTKFVAPGYANLCKGSDLTNPDSISALMTKMTGNNPDLEFFLHKDELSQQKVRFNEEGVIAITTIEENIVQEMALHAMKTAVGEKKKIIKPDHIIGGGYQDSPYYRLFDSLPRFDALVLRQQRREEHDANTKAKRSEMFKKARTNCSRQKIPYTQEHRPDVDSLPSFEETEVEQGHAIKQVVETTGKVSKSGKNEPRTVYLWKGIDLNDDDNDNRNDNISFEFYVDKLCKKIRETEDIHDNSGEPADGIKVSKDIKRFLSDTIIDWLTRFAPKLRILIEYNGVKTIDGNTVVAALKLMLSESYAERDGQINWLTDHQALFNDIERRLEMFRNHTSSLTSKSVVEDVDDDDDGLDDLDESESVAEVSVPTTRAAARAAARGKR